MPYSDLREFLDKLDKEGELARVKAQVDPDYEVGTIMRRVFDQRGKAVLFENVRGHTIPILSGALDTYKRYALGIESEQHLKAIIEKCLAAMRNPIAPVVVKEGPCQDNVILGDEVDLSRFPVPLWHHLDCGRYIGTLGVVISRDPETGQRNMGIYRQQVQGKNKVGILATQQMGMVLRKWLDRGQAMPVATAIGLDPAIIAASCFRPPLGLDELGLAGALRGKEVELVKCRTIDLEVPANAEIVLEGEIPADKSLWQTEGPFGEFTGYYGGVVSIKPTIYLKAVTHRDNPIYQCTLEGMPPCESTTLRTVGHTVGAWLKLANARIPGFKAVYLTDMGCANFMAIISLAKQYYLGNARQAIYALWALEVAGKWAIVVDDDIDIFDRAQVEWALATRVQPHRDIIISSEREPGKDLDPSIHPDVREYPWTQGSRIGIDATKGFKGFDFPPEIRSRAEDLENVASRWPEYGID